jgi:triosephosphate isomerase
MRKRIAAGNWKMNTSLSEGLELASELNDYLIENELSNNKKVIIAVPFTHIESIVKKIDYTKLAVGSQNCCQFDKGAYTGEISASMLKSSGSQYVIIGHSERRQYFGDTDKVIATKLIQCYKNTLIPIFCCGESLEQREQNIHFEVVEEQIKNAFAQIDTFNIQRTIIAYEPVWAIGTGKTATPQQAQEMHAHIRKVLSELCDANIANNLTILYGGSVNAGNSAELFSQPDIDGGLVGGASLKIKDFIQIINSL